ncbi:EAL domain-containing protein [Herbiconiux ginsengi]|uniref:Diguanylate cyclase (GGDEF) domain-containing protein n=1 Tax=Herbiconiux ginsengi TaxID=381665 RepID=A0A1H3TN71_9MICO|nr:EAL domain-containing protein [Herbiconiux ginsengi]SDZ51338.1 diguanylate cyclase (GGDEF) domain-containing protein [Herbiconiux ginsengi]
MSEPEQRKASAVVSYLLVVVAMATASVGVVSGLTSPPPNWITCVVFLISVGVTAVYQMPIGRVTGLPPFGVAGALLIVGATGANPALEVGLWTMAYFASRAITTRSLWMSAQWTGVAALGGIGFVALSRWLLSLGWYPPLVIVLSVLAYMLIVLALEFVRERGRWSIEHTFGISALSPWRLLGVLAMCSAVAIAVYVASTGMLGVVDGSEEELRLARDTIPLLVVALVFYGAAKRRQTRNSERRLSGVVDAARALPWDVQQDPKETMVEFARRAIDAAEFDVRRTPPGRNEIGARFSSINVTDPQLTPESMVPGAEVSEHQEDAVEPTEYLVASRKNGGAPFAPDDELALDAIGHIASETARVRGAYDTLLDRVDRDSLTGLPNYNAFQRSLARLNEDRSYASGIAVLFIDLDQFKRLNDTEGHHIGDEVLSTVATRLRASVRPHDFVARVGGDEFVVVLTKLQSLAESKAVADHIVANIGAPAMLGGREYRPLVSVGLAYSGHQETDPQSIVVDADHSMLAIKKSRRQGGPSFESSIGISPHRSSRINEIVAKAIDDGILNVVYQPIVNTVEDKIWAFESLVRYTHPELGRISTSSLIEKAKGLGRMDLLTKQVIEASLKAAREFRKIVPGISVMTINLEVEQIRDEHVGAFLKDIVPRYPDVSLCLELNERSTKDIDDDLRAQAEHFRQLGMLIALDDYGSEASSVGALVRIPMDILKIDRSLVDNLDDTRQREVVRALQGFGDAFDYSTVVEGIETQDAVDILVGIGVRHAQGFFYGRPVPFAQTMSRLKAYGAAGTVSRATPVAGSGQRADSAPSAAGQDLTPPLVG